MMSLTRCRAALARTPSLSTSAAAPAPARIAGVYPIMATPFRPDESLDLESFDRSVRFLKRAGVNGVTITGVLGESNRLLDAEREQLIRTAVAAAEGMPVVVGTSHAGTHATLGLSQMAEELGASAVMVTPTKEAAPLADDRMVEFFRHTAEGVSIPLVLQDHPASTQVHMSVPLLARIIAEVPRVDCVKLESVPTPVRISALHDALDAAGVDAPRRPTIMCGLGALYAGFDLGTDKIDGFMTGFAFPEALQAFVAAQQAGDRDLLMALYRHWLPLMVYEQQPGLAVRKEIYSMRGMIASAHVRHPAGSITRVAREQLRAVVADTLPDVDLTRPLEVHEVLRGAAMSVSGNTGAARAAFEKADVASA
jgi:4-hydroxy-tetrahydrodipicolinate synthase